MQGLALILPIADALANRGDVDAVVAENALQLRDVGKPRHVIEDQRLLGQKGCDHQRQRGILGARDRDGAVELVAADGLDSMSTYLGPALGKLLLIYRAGSLNAILCLRPGAWRWRPRLSVAPWLWLTKTVLPAWSLRTCCQSGAITILVLLC